MADTTIYPYGTNGQLPSSIGVINDLTTGGADKALSAEQGKELKEMIDNTGVSITTNDDTIIIVTATSPRLMLTPSSISFSDTIFDSTRTASVHVYGRNLQHEVVVQVSGVGFSGSTTLIPNYDGRMDEDVTITFAPTSTTGETTEYGKAYIGSVTVSSEGAESASATLAGVGVLTITPRVTATIDKDALKGVLSNTADGAYTSEPATATLHVQASNINQVLTLAVDNAKFALSESQISVEDALRGKDITVTYLRQSAVTDTDDEGTITITAAYDSTTEQSTVAVSGATAAKKTSGTIASIGGVKYFYYSGYESEGVYCEKVSAAPPTGDLVIDTFYDSYGYKYSPHSINTTGFQSIGITSLELGSTVVTAYQGAFKNCTSLKSVKFKSINTARQELFIGCTSLETVDMVSTNGFSNYQKIFGGCTKLKDVTIRSSSKVGIANKNNFTYKTMTVGGVEKEVFYYVDSDGKDQQKKLYVPSALVSSYQQDAIWGMFDVQAITE